MKNLISRLGRGKFIGAVCGVVLLAAGSLAVHADSTSTVGPDTHGGFLTVAYKDVSTGLGTLFAAANRPVDGGNNATNGYTHADATNLSDNKAANQVLQAKTSAGVLGGLHIDNENGSSAFVQCFDGLSANITLGTTVPAWQVKVLTVTSVDALLVPGGVTFTSGLTCYSSTATLGATGSGAGVHVSAFYN